jgi:PAS domain S-box-containing protein
VSKSKQTGTEPGDYSPAFGERVTECLEPSENECDFLSTVLGADGGVVLVTDARGLIVWVNKTCQDISGCSAAELRGRFIWDLARRADREPARRYFERVLSRSLTELGTRERLTEDDQEPQRRGSPDRAVALAQDISQPLEAIATYAQAGLLQLRKEPVDSDKLTDSFEKIALQVQSAAEILRDVRES